MALTLAIEAPIAAALAIWLGRAPVFGAFAAIAGSCLTHPILWAVFADAEPLFGALRTPVLEGLVMAAETVAYRAMVTPRWTEAVIFSVAANVASWAAGDIVYAM